MKRLILSAPFGNYLNFSNATSTLGTFTYKRRGGHLYRLWRILRTVRYYPKIKAWVNKLGLPNPGISWLVKKVNKRKLVINSNGLYIEVQPFSVSDKIISIAGHNLSDWQRVLSSSLYLMPLAIEMNVSCPNCPGLDRSDYKEVFTLARRMSLEVNNQTQIIIKLPPVGYLPLVRLALDNDFNSFHCCNTLPTPGGGLSGKPLKELSLQACRDVYNLSYAKGVKLNTLIGGGGVSTWKDAIEYLAAGATNISVGSALFFPWKWKTINKIGMELLSYFHENVSQVLDKETKLI